MGWLSPLRLGLLWLVWEKIFAVEIFEAPCVRNRCYRIRRSEMNDERSRNRLENERAQRSAPGVHASVREYILLQESCEEALCPIHRLSL